MQGKCGDCAYLFEQGELLAGMELDDRPTCLAFFPNSIPEEIYTGAMPHKTPYPGQLNDYVFKPLTEFVPVK